MVKTPDVGRPSKSFASLLLLSSLLQVDLPVVTQCTCRMWDSTAVYCPVCHDLNAAYLKLKWVGKDLDDSRFRHLADLATIRRAACSGCPYCKLLHDGILAALGGIDEEQVGSVSLKPNEGLPLCVAVARKQGSAYLEFYTLPGT